ncbi:benzyl alcohol O-benzoyltransferase-like [Triticum aestivum]|uniref:benzyl alcohol O-benzoyltransferase-like n=1 Tax=Triticum aestivum TaxID=4565 RepID=UPI001D005BFF|nr:benzyl alcohol O-benzoyltransferase-like [Triticum aestivum]
MIHLYRGDPSKRFIDPAAAVRSALAEALVHYYPLAGRLRAEAGRKLVVDCAGQGIVFAEADADIAVDDLGDVRYPPFPRSEKFTYDDHVYRAPPAGVPLSLPAIIDQPLMFVQVTRLKCGGFTVSQQNAHCICDGPGLAQFWKAVGELARGAGTPSVPPVWAREIFNARQPPRPSFAHHEYREPADGRDRFESTPPDAMARVQFSFWPDAIAALRGRLAPGAAWASQLDLVVACVWRSRTAALGYAPGDEVRLRMPVNARGRRADAFGCQIPAGYYSNAFAFVVAHCTAGELCGRGLGYAVELIRDAKARVTYEYMRSAADVMVLEGRPVSARKRTFGVSDVRHARFDEAEFGWGKPVYVGVITDAHRGGATFLMRGKDDRGEDETFIGIYLPGDCTTRYRMEVEALTAAAATAKNMQLHMEEVSSAPLALRARY